MLCRVSHPVLRCAPGLPRDQNCERPVSPCSPAQVVLTAGHTGGGRTHARSTARAPSGGPCSLPSGLRSPRLFLAGDLTVGWGEISVGIHFISFISSPAARDPGAEPSHCEGGGGAVPDTSGEAMSVSGGVPGRPPPRALRPPPRQRSAGAGALHLSFPLAGPPAGAPLLRPSARGSRSRRALAPAPRPGEERRGGRGRGRKARGELRSQGQPGAWSAAPLHLFRRPE